MTRFRRNLFPIKSLFYIFVLIPGLDVLFQPELKAQNICETALIEAEKAYEAGQFDRAIQLLTPCLPHGIPGKTKKQAYRILALAYVALDYIDEAEDVIQELLIFDYYEPDEKKDPRHFRELVYQSPYYRIGLGGGVLILRKVEINGENRVIEWSDKYIKYLREFFSGLPPIRVVTMTELLSELYGHSIDTLASSLSIDETNGANYNSRYFIVSSKAKKVNKNYVIESTLTRFNDDYVFLKIAASENNLRDLADSIGVRIVNYFGYRTTFKGVAHSWRKWSIRVAVAGLIATPFLVSAASRSKSDFEETITAASAESAYDALRRNEILRNTTISITLTSLVFRLHAQFINPRRPVFEKQEVKIIAKRK